MNRREFMAGCAAVAAAPALPDLDPMVRFITYQSWPFGTPRPREWSAGMYGSAALDEPRYPLSRILKPYMTYYRIEAFVEGYK